MPKLISIRFSTKIIPQNKSNSSNKSVFRIRRSAQKFNDFDDKANDIIQYQVKYRTNIGQLIYFLHYFDHFSEYRDLIKNNFQKLLNLNDNRKIKTNHPVILSIKCHLNEANLTLLPAIDIDWCNRLRYYPILRMELEESLSWLSTLGGAYSSLGDHNLQFAIEAEKISWKQMKLSFIYGDPNLICRCLIYLCHSYCQQKRRHYAIRLIRSYVYPFIFKLKQNNHCDLIVQRMYRALCFRIRFIYK